MTNTPSVLPSHSSLGDTAVDGLLAGGLAGAVMALYLLAAGMISGVSWQAVLSQFDPSSTPTPLAGTLTHVAVAGVFGVLFSLLRRLATRAWRGLPGWLAGAVYGLLLWLLAIGVSGSVLAVGGGHWLSALPAVHLALSHLLFGVTLGWLIGRMPRH